MILFPIMKNSYNDAAFFLLLHIAALLILMGGQLMGVTWPIAPGTGVGRMLTHPELVAVHLIFSSSLLFLFWLKNEKTYKLMLGITVAACIYGLFTAFYFAIGPDFLLIFGASRIARYSAPLAFPNGLGIFAKPIHRADEDRK